MVIHIITGGVARALPNTEAFIMKFSIFLNFCWNFDKLQHTFWIDDSLMIIIQCR